MRLCVKSASDYVILERYRNTQAGKQRSIQAEGQIDRNTKKKTYRKTNRQTKRKTYTEADTLAEKRKTIIIASVQLT